MNKVVEIKNLSKIYKIKDNKTFLDYFKFSKKQIFYALEDIDIEIQEGESVALLGLNGAGKSTLIKCIVGLLKPDKGSVRVLNKTPQKDQKALNFEISVVFGQRSQLRWDLSVKESYDLIKEMYEVSDKDYKEKLDILEDYLNLSEIINKPVRTLSLGQKMRSELGAALIYNPKLLILDEPTIGLDVFSKEQIIKLLIYLKSKGVTILLTTHDILEVDKLCDRIIILKNGEKIIDASKREFISKEKIGRVMKVYCSKNINLKDFEIKENIEIDKNEISFININSDEIPKYIEKVNLKYEIIDVKINDLNFEDVFKSVFKENEYV